MPIFLHIILTYVIFIGGFLAVAFSVISYWGMILNAVPESWSGAKSMIGFGIAVGVLWLGTRPARWFAKRVPVRCPKAGCSGRAYAKFAPTLTYTCETCGYVRRTIFS